MAAATQIGRGILINEAVGLGVGKVSEVFQAGRGARSVHVCCHVTAGGAVTASFLVEVEDPTTEKESTFTGLEQVTFQTSSSDAIQKDTIKKYNFEGGAGSRVRCTVTPDAAATVKVWAWSSY
jgi:hypothetical protein